jgi:hypothetical protein
MKISKVFLLMIAFSFPSMSLAADMSLLVSHGYDNKYIVGSGTEIYQDMFSKTLVSAQNGDYFAELWIGTGLQEQGGVLEIDYTLGKLFQIDRFAVKAKVDWFDVYGPDNLGFDNVDGDVFHIALHIQHPLNSSGDIFMFTEAEYFSVMSQSKNNGTFTNVGIGYTYSIDKFSATGKVRVGYDGTFQVDEPYARFEAFTSYAVNKSVTISGPGFNFIDRAGTGSVESYNILGFSHKF